MKRLNARRIKASNKMLLLAATVYNLKNRTESYSQSSTNDKPQTHGSFCSRQKQFTAIYSKANTERKIFPSLTMLYEK